MALEIEVRWARPQGRRGDLVGEGHEALGIVEHGPGDDHLLVRRAGPFHVGDGDLAQHAAPDRIVDELGAEGLGEAFPLEGLLVRIHGKGDVDGHDEGEVDLGLGVDWARGAATDHRQDQSCGEGGRSRNEPS